VLLAIDTSGDVAVSLLALDDGRPGPVLAARRATEPRRHAELLAPMITEALAEAGGRRHDVRAVVVGTGPAPYTGLRAGLVTARVLARALGVPVHGVPSLDALAAQAYAAGVATEDDVRRIALSLPETTEKPWYGTPGFRVKDKGFLRIRTEAEGGLVVFVADLDEKEALLASDPAKFFTTPHYDGYATVLVHLDAVGVDELTELITDSWRTKAPKRVLAAYLADHPDP